jgi:hypothetical protein
VVLVGWEAEWVPDPTRLGGRQRILTIQPKLRDFGKSQFPSILMGYRLVYFIKLMKELSFFFLIPTCYVAGISLVFTRVCYRIVS